MSSSTRWMLQHACTPQTRAQVTLQAGWGAVEAWLQLAQPPEARQGAGSSGAPGTPEPTPEERKRQKQRQRKARPLAGLS